MSRFEPDENEKIIIEGRATGKQKIGAIRGYAFLTSRRFVFCCADTALSGVLSGTPYNEDILFSVALTDISGVEKRKHGISTWIVISCQGGETQTIFFDAHAKWLSALQDSAMLAGVAVEPSSASADAGSGQAWYYEDNGGKVGPVPFSRMKTFATNNHTIYRFTKVWRDDMPDWQKAEDTELGQYFEGPPPLTGADVNNTVVWILAFAPVIGVNIENFLGGLFGNPRFDPYWLITIGLNITLSLIDEHKLVAAGHNVRAGLDTTS